MVVMLINDARKLNCDENEGNEIVSLKLIGFRYLNEKALRGKFAYIFS